MDQFKEDSKYKTIGEIAQILNLIDKKRVHINPYIRL